MNGSPDPRVEFLNDPARFYRRLVASALDQCRADLVRRGIIAPSAVAKAYSQAQGVGIPSPGVKTP